MIVFDKLVTFKILYVKLVTLNLRCNFTKLKDIGIEGPMLQCFKKLRGSVVNVMAEKSFTEKMLLDKAFVTHKKMNPFFRPKNKRYSLRYPDGKAAHMLPDDSEVFTI